MKITSEIYKLLLECPQVPPEIGGILGGKNDIIEKMIVDEGKKSCIGIQYVPDVMFINKCIGEWDDLHIEFYGMFHTHLDRWKTLSDRDKEYIKRIMNVMPGQVEDLYFPLVFPKNKVKFFKAVKSNNKIHISEEKIEIVY